MNDKQIVDVSKTGGISEKAFRFFCRHLVVLTTAYQIVNENGDPQGTSEVLMYSGCILSIKNKWLFLTAGHILKDIEGYLNNKRIKLSNWRILDNFGPDPVSNKSIPFDFINCEKCYIDEGGLDFGIIILHDHYRRLLEANGIVPISEDNWLYQSNIKFDRFCMLGLPTKFIKSAVVDTQNLWVDYAPTVIGIKNIHEVLSESKYPRLKGEIDEKCALDDIDGMSGGPILGFTKGRYWIIGIQSSWLESKKIIFACSVPLIARLVVKAISAYNYRDNSLT